VERAAARPLTHAYSHQEQRARQRQHALAERTAEKAHEDQKREPAAGDSDDRAVATWQVESFAVGARPQKHQQGDRHHRLGELDERERPESAGDQERGEHRDDTLFVAPAPPGEAGVAREHRGGRPHACRAGGVGISRHCRSRHSRGSARSQFGGGAAPARAASIGSVASEERTQPGEERGGEELIGPDDVAYRLELTPAQLKVTWTALKTLMDDLGHDEHDVLEIVRQVLAKLPDEHAIRAIRLS